MANSDKPGSVGDDATKYETRRDEDVAVATAPISPPGSASDPAASEGAPSASTPASGPAPRSSVPSFLLLLLGGFLAGAIGYFAAYYTNFGLFGSSRDIELTLAAQESAIAAQEERLDEVEAALGASANSAQGFEQLEQQVSELDEGYARLESDLAGLGSSTEPGIAAEDLQNLESAAQARFDALAQQVAELQSRLEGEIDAGPSEAVQALQERVAQLQSRLDEQANAGPSDEVQALQEWVAALSQQLAEQDEAIADAREAALREARLAAVSGAVAEVRAAVESGEPFDEALGTLEAAGTVEVPEVLERVASSGVATRTELQERFPEAARDALDASLSQTAGDGALDRFGAFLKAQTGARSVGEREGSSADAILSRAEARVDEGDFEAALSELEALPDAGRSAMSDWIDAARTRLDARSAAASLSPTSNSN